MDIVNHAIAGAVIGSKWDMPLLGAVAGIAPDLADVRLLYRRQKNPIRFYEITHSVELCLAVLSLGLFLGDKFLAWSIAWCSHIVLDYFTHNRKWGPKFVIIPIRIQIRFDEWEFYNRSWWRGFFLNLSFCLGALI